MIKIGNENIVNVCLGEDAVPKIYIGDEEVYSSKPVNYLTYEALEDDSEFALYHMNMGNLPNDYIPEIYYSLNNGAWLPLPVIKNDDESLGDDYVPMMAGDKIRLKGKNPKGISIMNSTSLFDCILNGFYGFKRTLENETEIASFKVYGDITTLINKRGNVLDISGCNPGAFGCLHGIGYFIRTINIVNTAGLILPSTKLCKYAYAAIFQRCASLTTTPELPATTLAPGCYLNMFADCTSLTTAPELPATTLSFECYYQMFADCTSLTSAPKLPATTLTTKCYYGMFYGCTSLTTAPELPAPTLTKNCYGVMFYNCKNLNFIKCLATDISAEECTSNWVSGVSSTGTFIKNPAMTSWTIGNNGIPEGWVVMDTEGVKFTAEQNNSTIGLEKLSSNQQLWYSNDTETWYVLDTASTITLSNSGDSVYIRGMLSSDNTEEDYTHFSMTGKIAANGNCNYLWNYENPNAPLKKYCGIGMFFGCVSLTTAPALPAATLAEGCYESLFAGCTNLTTAPKLPATTLESSCYTSMFWGCANLTTAPELPATTLSSNCYNNMFNGCTNLNYIKCLATDISAENCTNYWVTSVSSTGTFVKNPEMSGWTRGVNGIPANWTVYNYYEPLKFTAEQDNSTIGLYSLSTNQTLEYSTDRADWVNMDSATTITLSNSGDSVYIRGMLIGNNTLSNSTQFKMTGKISASGSCNYIWNYQNPDAPLKQYCGCNMFAGCTSLTTAPELPATTLAEYCYYQTFLGCTSLTTAPELPATILVPYCYGGMFRGCTSLVETPTLLATELPSHCYYYMFYGCTSLVTAPELPATTLDDWCYYEMFYGCTSLTAAPELPATTLAECCYSGMFSCCTSLRVVLGLPATTLARYCYYWMFAGCTSLTTAPELPATTLAESCYGDMFRDCTSLTTAPELPATTLALYCYANMFCGCTSLTTVSELLSTTLSNHCYEGMFYRCTSLASAPVLPATNLTPYCYCSMFNSCTSLTTAPELPADTLAQDCYCSMFNGCTSLTTAPELPAAILVQDCYEGMFEGCSSLNYIKCLATNISATRCTNNWVRGVSNSGAFVKSQAMSGWTTGVSGIPTGWVVEDAE